MNINTRIKQLGLTETETAVYLASLELGESTITEITKKAVQKRPTVYLALDRLEMLGLVERVVRGKKKLWNAVHPRRLKELAYFRASQIDEALPELIALYKDTGGRPTVRVLEGIEGVKTAYKEAFSLLDSKQEGLWLGNITILKEKFPEIFREYNAIIRQLRDPHIKEIIYGGEVSKLWTEEMRGKASKNHQLIYIEGDNFGQTDQLIIGNKVISFSLGKEIFVRIII